MGGTGGINPTNTLEFSFLKSYRVIWVKTTTNYAKFLEADLVVVQTSGNDIMDYYFSNRLKLSRNKASVKPSEAELAIYNELYKK